MMLRLQYTDPKKQAFSSGKRERTNPPQSPFAKGEAGRKRFILPPFAKGGLRGISKSKGKAVAKTRIMK